MPRVPAAQGRLNHDPGFHLSCDENLSEGWGPPLTWEQYAFEIGNCLSVRCRNNVGVDVQCGRDRCVAELLLRDLDRDAQVVQQRRMHMP